MVKRHGNVNIKPSLIQSTDYTVLVHARITRVLLLIELAWTNTDLHAAARDELI